ncbi:WD40 repeat-like protein [Thelephora ganbajun]|uniref:WD40 repeat-like protein n=1 Tax=Thelephora ganbajun TaxID=370292 RepID=A0ACB6ZIP2_THEGA|nr:WD40 repeat-like protein [Thelephora ganbajun]
MSPWYSFSGLKNVKDRLSGNRLEPDGGEVGIRGGRVRPTDPLPHPEPHVRVVVDSGKVDPHSGESENNSVNPDHAQVLRLDKNEQNATRDNKSDWKSTVSSTTKLLLCAVRDPSDVFPPLKSVAGGLCSILENYERAQSNRQEIESEESRRKKLEQKLEGIDQDLTLLAEQGRVAGFLNNARNADKLGDLLEDIRDAMMEYQTSLQQGIYDKSCRLIESADLALLNGMHHTTGAGYLSGNRQGCLGGTRKDVLWQIERWLTDERDQRVFWLNGLAGTGKSTIAQTFAETSFSDGKLGASFFCSRDFEDRSNIQTIFPTLAFQLAYRYPQFRKELFPILRANPEIGQESLCSQLEKVIIGPLRATRIPTLIIIDALDECKDKEPASAILSVLSRYVDQIPGVKFFITGRPEPRIRTGFRLEPLRPITEVLKLHDVERSSVDGDIKLFLETRLNDIAKTRSNCDFTEDWLSSYDIDVLSKKAAGLFIYASTIAKFVASPDQLPTERLTLIISLPQSTVHEGKSGIDLLYLQVLEQAFRDVDLDERELYSRFKLVVGAVLLVFHPLSRKTLSELLKNCGTPSRISNALRSLHSLLLVPKSEVDPIRIFHKSFPDFLTDPGRCKDERFLVDPSVHHIDILFSCLDLMKERLRRNICDLDGCPTLSEVKDLPTRREACIGSALEYACRFWTKHLAKVPGNGPHAERAQEAVDEFFTTRLLFWIEVLSLTGNLNLGVYALHDIDQWYLSVSCKWTNESQRLILSNFDEICHSPAKLYRYVLPFCPSSSWLHEWYTTEFLQEVKVVGGRPDEWGGCSRVVSFDHSPEALAHQKDIVTVGLSSGHIVILDAITGTRRSVLSGHTDSVISLAYSPDGTLLVSGSKDNTVKLWDVQTGGVVKTFHSNVHRVYSVSISPDAITIASGSHNGVICLWDVRTGVCRRTLENALGRKGDPVTCVSFVPTISGCLMSTSADGSVRQWDVEGCGIKRKPFAARYIAFSSDGKRFVSCGRGHPVVRYNDSGIIIVTLPSPGQDFSCCCFSPSNERVAGAADATVYVWDVTHSSPHLIGTFVPHGSKISSLLYSSSLISTSNDKTVRFWQINDSSSDTVSANTQSTALSLAKVTRITLQAEEGIVITIDSVGVAELWDLSTGLRKALPRAIQAGVYMSDARLVDGAFAVIFREDEFPDTWRISQWNIEEGRCLRTIQLHGATHRHCQLRISGDGTRVFEVGEWGLQTWSASTGGSAGWILFDRPYKLSSISVVVDGPVVWIHSGGYPTNLKRWDVKNREPLPINPSDVPPDRHRLAFIQVDNSERQNADATRIEDTVIKKEVFRLPSRFAQPIVSQWDGRYLIAAYRSGELLILDFAHMIPSEDL